MYTRHLARAATLILAIIFVIWLILMLVGGMPRGIISAVQLGQPRPQGQLLSQGPYLPALYPIFALSIIILGLVLSFSTRSCCLSPGLGSLCYCLPQHFSSRVLVSALQFMLRCFLCLWRSPNGNSPTTNFGSILLGWELFCFSS